MDLEKILTEEEQRRNDKSLDDPKVVEAHVDVHTFTEIEVYPDHEQRATSSLFRKNKKMLQDELGYGCWICGAKHDLEVHHWFEWSLFNALDKAEALKVLNVLDVYGFAKKMKGKPFDTPDDIRNLVVLCKDHHRTPGTGIHTMTFPIWIAQKVDKTGMEVAVSVSAYKKAQQKVKSMFMKLKEKFTKKRG